MTVCHCISFQFFLRFLNRVLLQFVYVYVCLYVKVIQHEQYLRPNVFKVALPMNKQNIKLGAHESVAYAFNGFFFHLIWTCYGLSMHYVRYLSVECVPPSPIFFSLCCALGFIWVAFKTDRTMLI